MMHNEPHVAGNHEGDAFPWESLIAQHRGQAFDLAFFLTRNRARAEMIVEQAAHRARCNRGALAAGTSFWLWYRDTVRDLATSGAMPAPEAPLFNLSGLLDFGAPEPPDSGAPTAGAMFQRDISRFLDALERDRREDARRTLAHLPPDQRAILAMTHRERLSPMEIATDLNLPPSTVLRTIEAATANLRSALKGAGPTGETDAWASLADPPPASTGARGGPALLNRLRDPLAALGARFRPPAWPQPVKAPARVGLTTALMLGTLAMLVGLMLATGLVSRGQHVITAWPQPMPSLEWPSPIPTAPTTIALVPVTPAPSIPAASIITHPRAHPSSSWTSLPTHRQAATPGAGSPLPTTTTTIPPTATPTPRAPTTAPTATPAPATATPTATSRATPTPTPIPVTPTWAPVANLAAPQSSLAAVTDALGNIYAIGGSSSGMITSTVGMVEVYRPGSGTWSFVTSMPTARSHIAAALGADGHVYVIGGETITGATTSLVEVYDPGTDTWTTAASLPWPRADLAVVAGPDKRIYAIGGEYGNHPWNTVAAYTPGVNAWTLVAPMPTPRRWLAAVTGADQRIYAIGGDGKGSLATVEVYSPTVNSWGAAPSLPVPVAGLAAVADPDGRIYAMGGSNGGNVTSAVEAYSPRMRTWTPLARLATARWQLAAAAGPDHRVYAIGGLSRGGDALSTVEAYDPGGQNEDSHVAHSSGTGAAFDAAAGGAARVEFVPGEMLFVDPGPGHRPRHW